MDYEAEQRQEIEALEAIYPNEIRLICSEYPEISFTIAVSSSALENATSSQNEEENDEQVSCGLRVTFPSKYPDCVPEFSLRDPLAEEDDEDDEVQFDKVTSEEIVEKLRETAEESVGMAMVFSLVSALQEKLVDLHVKLAERRKYDADATKRAEEEEERKKIEGTRVTVENFIVWKKVFDAEKAALKEKNSGAVSSQKVRKLTGKELFLQDSTLSLSDIALIQEGENVEIDESLFEDMDELELEDEEEEQ